LGLTNVAWKYYAQGDAPGDIGGLTWKQPGFNDSAWGSGRGTLGFENTAGTITALNNIGALTNTILPLSDAGNNRIITYYFRNTFVLTNDPATVIVMMTNIVDDGAAVYLNGTEVWRFDLPSGNLGYAVQANSATTEGVFQPGTNFPSGLLVKGTNTIAVEVHQDAPTSSDILFGMRVQTIIPPPSLLVINSQPQSQIVEQDKDASFTVGFTGGDPHIQWYKDGIAISNGIAATLTVPIVVTNDAGIYQVVITNIVNSVTSSPVTLTVYADTNAPALIDADGSDTATNVFVTFTERLTAATATNTANYKITNMQGGTIAVTKATLLSDNKSVSLTSAARTFGANYVLIVNNLRDLASPTGNLIPANSAVPIRQGVTLLPMYATHKYYAPIPDFPLNDPVEIGTTWKEPGYDEASSGLGWADGAALFYNGLGDVPGDVNTALGQSSSYVDYYRARFDSQNISPGGLILTMTHIVDDGAIFYLNGQEFYRFNMQSSALSSNDTPANATVGDPARVEVPVPGSLIVTGQNVLAVSVHQAQRIDIDRAFGAELKARAQSFLVGPPMITGGPQDIWVQEGQTATFAIASVGAFRFRWQSNGVAIANATNSSYTTPQVTTNMNGTTYRVGVSNATAGVLSTNATLHVIADTNGPTILSAVISSNNTIVIRFNEPLAITSAQNAANYAVVNAANGSNVTVSGASLVNSTNVVLSFASTLAGRYTITINNVADASSQANKIAPNSKVTVGADYNIGMLSPWKYLLINTNEEVQETFSGVAYDDSSWSGPSNALFYVEGAALPFAKSTALTLTASDGGTINTYYFRKSFFAAVGSTNIIFSLRHVIDDGLVLYLNGREIYRYNMPAGTVTASTQALSPAIGDAALAGPFNVVVTNLIGGTNIFAAEVHQNGAASSDVVFGIELIGSLPSIVDTNTAQPVQIVTQPQSRTNAVGSTASFSVGANGSPTIYYQWRTNGVAILNATNATLNFANVQLSDNGKAFTVVVSNFVNSVTSTIATLTVTNPVICTPVTTWTNSFKLSVIVTNGTNIALSWTNPETNSCHSNAAVILRHATEIKGIPATLSWTNIFTNATGPARVIITNGVTSNPAGAARFYKLQVGP